MRNRIDLQIHAQPTDFSCGPTCLHAVYRFWGDEVSLEQVVREVAQLDPGGTMAVLLALHALRRGFEAKIYTYNLQVFDPTWFRPGADDIRDRLREQLLVKSDPKVRLTSQAFIEFLDLGGEVEMRDLTRALLREHLTNGTPILTGLSATWLYQGMREIDDTLRDDDVLGVPQGHFVVLCGYDKKRRSIAIADPLQVNPVSPSPYYEVGVDRLVSSILLGILTYDANMLLIRPAKARGK
jgi:hypothetical protein